MNSSIKMYSNLFRLLIVICLTINLNNCYDDWVYKTVRDSEEKSENIDECGICKLLSESFTKAMDKTLKDLEPKEANYENSELRLTEIQEMICNELQYGKNKCSRLASDQEDAIEHWWYNVRQKESFFQSLCIRKFKLCCLAGSYGPKCKKCPGAPSNICNQNGVCDGDGTRKGDGSCICNEGSTGVECDECKHNFTKTEKGKCVACDKACQNGCFKVGKEGCHPGCADGFREDGNNVCQDIDECIENPKLCEEGTVCQNFYGGYECIVCNKVCKTCFGHLENECFECADGYIMEGKNCIPYEESKKSNQREIMKYLIYILAMIFGCFLMSKHILVGFLYTIFFSVCIALHEYTIVASLSGPMEAFEQFFL